LSPKIPATAKLKELGQLSRFKMWNFVEAELKSPVYPFPSSVIVGKVGGAAHIIRMARVKKRAAPNQFCEDIFRRANHAPGCFRSRRHHSLWPRPWTIQLMIPFKTSNEVSFK
jgi:hypothetical protein